MARVPYVGGNDMVMNANIFRTFAHRPNLADAYGKLGGRLLFRGDLDPKVREIVINAISRKLDCEYEWSHHAKMGLDAGMTVADLEAVRDARHDALTPLERACVEYAFKVEDRTVEDADVDAVRAAGLSDADVVELTLLAGFYGMTARFLLAMGVEVDDGNPSGFALP